MQQAPNLARTHGRNITKSVRKIKLLSTSNICNTATLVLLEMKIKITPEHENCTEWPRFSRYTTQFIVEHPWLLRVIIGRCKKKKVISHPAKFWAFTCYMWSRTVSITWHNGLLRCDGKRCTTDPCEMHVYMHFKRFHQGQDSDEIEYKEYCPRVTRKRRTF